MGTVSPNPRWSGATTWYPAFARGTNILRQEYASSGKPWRSITRGGFDFWEAGIDIWEKLRGYLARGRHSRRCMLRSPMTNWRDMTSVGRPDQSWEFMRPVIRFLLQGLMRWIEFELVLLKMSQREIPCVLSGWCAVESVLRISIQSAVFYLLIEHHRVVCLVSLSSRYFIRKLVATRQVPFLFQQRVDDLIGVTHISSLNISLVGHHA